ncbi:MAG: AMP-binding protein, partial [bacterium]|nr:AMP-binding protein [bacterium]
IDVEKSEADVLEGIGEEDWSRIRQLVVEVHDSEGRLETVTQLFKRHKFDVIVEQEQELGSSKLYNVYAKQPPAKDKKTAAVTPHPNQYLGVHQFIAGMTDYLKERLPEYMVPHPFVLLEKLPLTANGKLDRRALPKPLAPKTPEAILLPQTPTQQTLARLWSQVLSVEEERIGLNSDFFNLGGHSLKATLLSAKIHKELGVRVPLPEIFKSPRLQSIALFIDNVQTRDYSIIPPAEKKEYYPQSPAQKRLFLLDRLDNILVSYNIPSIYVIRGKLDFQRYQTAFDQLIARHETLRTSFHLVDNQPVQIVHEAGDIKSTVERIQSKDEIRDAIKSFIRPFDLSTAPLTRSGIVEISGRETLLMLDMHHIISDGVSHSLLARDFMALYEGKELPQPALQYKDYASRQAGETGIKNTQTQKTYWLQRFSGEIPVINLPTDYARPRMQQFQGQTIPFLIKDSQVAALREIAAREGVSLFMVLLALFNIFLSKVSRDQDIVIGTGTEGRPHHQLRSIVGMFVNTLAMRHFPRPQLTFPQFLAQLKTAALEDLQHQDYPFEDIVEHIGVKRDTSRNPLFDVMFQFNNIEIPELSTPELSMAPYSHDRNVSKFDLTLWAWEREQELSFSLEYSTRLFKPQTIRQFIVYFKEIIHDVIQNPGLTLSEYRRVSGERKREILESLNRGIDAEVQRMAGLEQVLQHRLVRGFQKYEDNIAIEYGTRTFTYGELDQYSNRIAHGIIARGIGKGSFIGVLTDDRMGFICTALGILKAGGVFVPLDTTYPQSRLELMATSVGIKTIITGAAHTGLFAGNPEILILAFQTIVGKDREYGKINPAIQYLPEDPVYIDFAAGSPGVPKAILGKNVSLVHFIDWEIDTFGIDETYRFSQLTNPG